MKNIDCLKSNSNRLLNPGDNIFCLYFDTANGVQRVIKLTVESVTEYLNGKTKYSVCSEKHEDFEYLLNEEDISDCEYAIERPIESKQYFFLNEDNAWSFEPPTEQYVVKDIEWDIDNNEFVETIRLPGELVVNIPCALSHDKYCVKNGIIDMFISDWLSDTYGFCHCGFKYDKLKETK